VTLEPDHLYTGIARIKLGRSLLRQRRLEDAARETRAGYDIVSAQSSPSVSWLTSARTDLVAAYEGLGRADEAARFKAELADTARATPN
jgi:serine/threonine-protein kinase